MKPYEDVGRIDGYLMYLKGHRHPMKGIPDEKNVQIADQIKKCLFKPWNLRHITPTEPTIPCAKEVLKFFTLINQPMIGKCIAHVLEYDWAYRVRFQDMMSQTESALFIHSPLWETRRILRIYKNREPYPHTYYKIYFLSISRFALYLPKVKQALREIDFKALQLDEADRYWMSLKYDYGQK